VTEEQFRRWLDVYATAFEGHDPDMVSWSNF
jgi:hypothetical protein